MPGVDAQISRNRAAIGAETSGRPPTGLGKPRGRTGTMEHPGKPETLQGFKAALGNFRAAPVFWRYDEVT